MSKITEALNKKYAQELDEPEVTVVEVEESEDDVVVSDEVMKAGLECEEDHVGGMIDKLRTYLDKEGCLPESEEILKWIVEDHVKEYGDSYYTEIVKLESKLEKSQPKED